MLAPVTLSDFAGGLHLIDQASELDTNTALDLQNVRFGSAGEVRRRGGSEVLGSVSFTGDIKAMHWAPANTDHILCADGSNVRALTVAGAETANIASTDGKYGFADYGAPTTERCYGANGTHLFYWDGTTFTTNPTVTYNGTAAQQCPRSRTLAVTPWDNRLMAIGYDSAGDGPGGAGGTPHTIFFSEAGDPAVWKSTWREHLTPGDGEELIAAVAWRDYVFVFKQTKFFVFTSTTDAGGGNPRFNYYAVQAGVGAMNPMAVCAARDGVYFVDRKGIYRTQGEEPELISWRLAPAFEGGNPVFFTGQLPAVSSIAQATIAAVGEHVYVFMPTSSNWKTWVFDPRYDWWGYDTLQGMAGCPMQSGGLWQLAFANKAVKKLHRHTTTLADDSGTAITGVWRGAWLTHGGPSEKILQRMRLFGSGVVAVSCATDLGQAFGGHQVDLSGATQTWADGTNAADKWGGGADPAQTWAGGTGYSDGWCDWAWKGEVFSMQVAGVNGSDFSIQRVEHHVSTPRRVGYDSLANA